MVVVPLRVAKNAVFLQKAILCSTWWAGGCLFCETDRAAPQVSQVRRGPKVRGMSLACAAVPAPGGASPTRPRICCRNETASAARQDMEKLEGSPFANFVLLDSPAAPFRERRRLGSETLQTHSSSKSLPYGPARRVEQPLGCSTCVARGSGSRLGFRSALSSIV